MKLVLKQQQQEEDQQQQQHQSGEEEEDVLPTYRDAVGEEGEGDEGETQQHQPMISTRLNAGSCQITVVSPSQDKGEVKFLLDMPSVSLIIIWYLNDRCARNLIRKTCSSTKSECSCKMKRESSNWR